MVEPSIEGRTGRASIPTSVGLLVVIGFNGLLAGFLLFAPLPDAQIVIVDNLAQAIGPLAIASGGLIFAPRRGGTSDWLGRWAPCFLALACVSWASGQLGWSFYELVLRRPVPLGSWSDLGFFAAYPLLLCGIFGLCRAGLTLATRARMMLDGLLVAVTLAAFSWYFLLGPTLLRSDQPGTLKAVNLAYPLCDLALIGALLWLGLGRGGAPLDAPMRLLVAGLALIAVTNTAFHSLVLRGSYATGTVLDVGWPLGYMLIGLAACRVRRESGHAEGAARPDGRPSADAPGERPLAERPVPWRGLLPYLSLPIVGLLYAHGWYTGAEPTLLRGVVAMGGALLALVILHQMLVIAEGWQFARDLDSVYRATLGQMEQRDQWQRLATTDALTGLLNRRGLNAAMEEVLGRAATHSTTCAVVLLDLDHFKALNDRHGHLVGDEALREVGALLQGRQQGELRAGRWGGEEFLVVLPGRDEAAALDFAEALRATVAAHTCPAAGGIRITCSIGVAVYPRDGRDAAGLIAAADRAMYAAKCLGRNRVFAAGDPAVAALMADAGAEAGRGEEALAGTTEERVGEAPLPTPEGGRRAQA